MAMLATCFAKRGSRIIQNACSRHFSRSPKILAERVAHSAMPMTGAGVGFHCREIRRVVDCRLYRGATIDHISELT
jgi:hypothetical protein